MIVGGLLVAEVLDVVLVARLAPCWPVSSQKHLVAWAGDATGSPAAAHGDRHLQAGRDALRRVAAVLGPGGRVVIDGGDPLREIAL